MRLRTNRPLRFRLANILFPSAPSFSGAGEDRNAIAWIEAFAKIPFSEVRYLDVGACHPATLSNTFALYLRGARGVLVEPNPDLVNELRRARPDDVVICAGVAFDDQRTAHLHRAANPVFSSFVNGSGADRIVAPLVPLNDILREHFPSRPPDFLSIDAEGVDFAILKSINFYEHKPLVICIETSAGWNDYAALLSPHGYQIVCRTPDNAMFVRFG